jgi:putative spermidine/putrescine transport system permease protein
MEALGAWLGRVGLRLITALVLAFIYIPLLLVIVYAFNDNLVATWPPRGFTLEWWSRAINNSGFRGALASSLIAGLGATATALVLGSLAALAVHRFRFFGREAISFLVILPIALPGVVTGIAINSAVSTIGIPFGMLTVIIGHATFCVVLVYNNLIARLRRTAPSVEEASQDLGADTWQTFRYVTLPLVRTALLAGGLLAFALSFDEIIVTTFTRGGVQTLPIWIFNNYRLANQAPIVNVVAVVAILLSVLPVYIASRLTSDTAAAAGGRT